MVETRFRTVRHAGYRIIDATPPPRPLSHPQWEEACRRLASIPNPTPAERYLAASTSGEDYFDRLCLAAR